MGKRDQSTVQFTGRATQQRHLILDIVREADKHLDADDIYQRARAVSPHISLSTVYRNLRFLKDIGAVEELQLGGARRCYERAGTSGHHHMVCLGCGRVFEFTCPATESIKSKLSKQQGLRVTEVDVRLAGYCPECQRKLERHSLNEKMATGEKR